MRILIPLIALALSACAQTTPLTTSTARAQALLGDAR